jgi:hypothetical protein
VDKNLADASQSFLNIDTVAGEMCLAGLVRAIDATVSLNRRVTFSYDTSGPIAKDTEKKVDGVFTVVNLNLDITELRSATDGGPIQHYNKTIQVECKVKASLKQRDGLASVERATDRVSLDCDLQPGFEAFNEDDPFLDEVLLENIDDAYKNQRHVKANSRKGRLKIKSSGSEVFPEDRRNVVPTCTLSDPG